MTRADWIVIGVVVLFGLYGLARGLVRGALSLAGFALGAYLGARLAPALLDDGSPYTPLVALGGAMLGGFVFQTAAALVGGTVRASMGAIPGLRTLDSLAGAVFGIAAGFLVSWAMAAVLLYFPGQIRAPAGRAGVGDPVPDQRGVPARAVARDARARRPDRGAPRPAGDRVPSRRRHREGQRRGRRVEERRARHGNRLRSGRRGNGLDRAARPGRHQRARRGGNRRAARRSASGPGVHVDGRRLRRPERSCDAARRGASREAATACRARAGNAGRADRLSGQRSVDSHPGAARRHRAGAQPRCVRTWPRHPSGDRACEETCSRGCPVAREWTRGAVCARRSSPGEPATSGDTGSRRRSSKRCSTAPARSRSRPSARDRRASPARRARPAAAGKAG